MFFLCRKIDASEPVPLHRTPDMAKQIAISVHNNTFTQQQQQHQIRAQSLTRKNQDQRTLERNALQRKLQRIQDHNPVYHGPWVVVVRVIGWILVGYVSYVKKNSF